MFAANREESVSSIDFKRNTNQSDNKKQAKSSLANEFNSTLIAAQSNFCHCQWDSRKFYITYRGIILLQFLFFIMAAAFLTQCPLYEFSSLRHIFSLLSIEISVGELFYTTFYWFSGAVIACCSIFHFVPNAWVLNNFPTSITYLGKEAFTLTRTLLTFPAIRFYFSVTNCLPLNGNTDSDVLVVGGKYPGLICASPLQVAMKVFASIVVVLLIIAILHTIELRYSSVERAKIHDCTIFDERAKFYHQYTFMQSVVFSLATVSYTGVPGYILNGIIFVLSATCLVLHLSLDPYQDQRMLLFVAGCLSASTYTSLLCFMSWWHPNNFTLYVFFFIVPFIFAFGCYLAQWKRRQWLSAQFKITVSPKRTPKKIQKYCQKTMEYFLNEPLRKRGDFSQFFRGAPTLFLKNFITLVRTDTTLTFLILSLNFLQEDHVLHLFKALAYHPTLIKVDLCNNELQFANKKCVDILRMFFSRTKIHWLNLSRNPIGNLGLKYLTEALMSSGNLDLKHLMLSKCQLTSIGRVSLMQLLGAESKLTNVDLSRNSLGYNALVAISSAVKKNKKLKVLDLSWNRFDLRGVNDLKEAVMENRSLKELLLGSNGIPLEVIHSIQEMLRTNLNESSASKILSDDQIVREIGGPGVLNKIIEAFYIKVLKDPHLNHRFIILRMDRMRFLMFDYLHALFTGSMHNYPGKTLLQGHAHLKITSNEFEGVHMHLMNTLQDIAPDIRQSVKKHISNALESFRVQIVTKYEPPIQASVSSILYQPINSGELKYVSSSSTGFFSCYDNIEVPSVKQEEECEVRNLPELEFK
ncbi:hypothetical protein HMI54_007982 [Coelomomyces lativittatus]|nr:hypothetical protein HMI56_007408 [Coelomomyces lativittatus]KAJ1516847.1 hypothetical protein HMI54_007982 [Coelomomyces lativittatus]